MKRHLKTKRGFTLIEMVVVISIIIILASVFIVALSRFISLGNRAGDNVDQQHESMSSFAGSANARFEAVGF